jgi:hypothetical protein
VSVEAARDRLRGTLILWTGIGVVAFALLPWYLDADRTLLEAIRSQFSAPESASGLRAATTLGRPWLASALVALALCVAACATRARLRGWLQAGPYWA